MAMKLAEGLRVGHNSRLAFAGAGGKTTALFSLARQLPGLVLCLNTAHLAVEQAKLADQHIVITREADIHRALESYQTAVLLFTGPENDHGRLTGLSSDFADAVKKLADTHDLPVLIEADGSRRLPLKAPAEHEPPIPPWVNYVVYMFGLSAVGKPLDDVNVFRPEIFAKLTGVSLGSTIEIDAILRYLQNPLGGLKNIPSHARRTLLVNQLDVVAKPIEDTLSPLCSTVPGFDAVLAGSVEENEAQIQWRCEPVAGIILAAGASKRMGGVKQMLQWRGKPLVRHAAETAVKAGLNPVIVVTGAEAQGVESALAGLPVFVVFNSDWETGQASSIRVGVSSLPANSGGVVFLLSDMPQVPVNLIAKELEIHQNEVVPIICPRVKGQRTNPVFFDRQTFPALMELSGDSGGRVLFDRFPLRWLEWDDPVILQDIDTPSDYQNLIRGDREDG